MAKEPLKRKAFEWPCQAAFESISNPKAFMKRKERE